MFHSMLSRQLREIGLSDDSPPPGKNWTDFLTLVDQSYREIDRKRRIIERSLFISSQKMKEATERLRNNETRYSLAENGANFGLWDWNLETGETYYSERWEEILGAKCDTKNCWFDRIHSDDYDDVVKEFELHLEGRSECFESEHRVLYKNREYIWVLIRGVAVRDGFGKARRIAGSITDITARKKIEAKLTHEAAHDGLTGLPNRTKFMLRLSEALEKTKTDPTHLFAVLFIDLDRFKSVNDTFGHQAGDELLVRFTEKLHSIVRPEDTIARLGGDEFVLLLDRIPSVDKIREIALRLLAELRKPIRINGQLINWSASIGAAVSSSEYRTPDEVLCDSDFAMYRAKLNGKGRYEIFDPTMRSRTSP